MRRPAAQAFPPLQASRAMSEGMDTTTRAAWRPRESIQQSQTGGASSRSGARASASQTAPPSAKLRKREDWEPEAAVKPKPRRSGRRSRGDQEEKKIVVKVKGLKTLLTLLTKQTLQ